MAKSLVSFFAGVNLHMDKSLENFQTSWNKHYKIHKDELLHLCICIFFFSFLAGAELRSSLAFQMLNPNVDTHWSLQYFNQIVKPPEIVWKQLGRVYSSSIFLAALTLYLTEVD